MSLFEIPSEQPETEPRAQCACCQREAAESVWDYPLCASCTGAWFREPAFEAGRVVPDILDIPSEEIDQRYRELMAKWVQARKAVAA